jgi:hypothetical protein
MKLKHAPKYFKVTNFKELHYGLQYNDGLIKDPKSFNKEGSCVPGGIYFTTKKYISRFYGWGVWLRPVHLPLKDPNFQMVADGNKFRANMVILGERHSLCDLKTYYNFNLDIPSPEFMIRNALKYKDFESANKLFGEYKNFIIELNLSGLGLEEIPQGIEQLIKLTTLYLNNNIISDMPDRVLKMPKLRQLYLCNNDFNTSTKKYKLGGLIIQTKY